MTLVDRKSGLICGWVVHSRQAWETRSAIVEALKEKPVKSLSLDNGSEFAEFRELEERLKAPIFFAEPHKPWQRGCNENANGLLRYFFPRGCNFLDVSQAEFRPERSRRRLPATLAEPRTINIFMAFSAKL